MGASRSLKNQVMSKGSWAVIVLAVTALLLPYRADPASMEYFVNDALDYDYGVQTVLPTGFGEGEFTLELWIKPNESFPVGSTVSGADQRRNWSSSDVQPYSSESWWYAGNFLLDGHNNNAAEDGTFSLQFYGGGRVRWLFGDGSYPGPGSNWSVGAYPANTAPSLLDGAWHQLTLVRRWSGSSSSQLELWIDGELIAAEVTPVRPNMRQWWDSWAGFPGAERGWFWGAEKQAAVGALDQYEDYKGLLDEVRFWDRAKSAAEIGNDFATPVSGSENGLVGVYRFIEGAGTSACDSLSANRCISIVNAPSGVWNGGDAPLTGGTPDTQAPTAPGSPTAQGVSASRIDLVWNASSDNIGVTAYEIRRNGLLVASVSTTSYSDTGLAANTTYSYTVTARDAAGNSSAASSASGTTLAEADTQAPTAPGSLTAQGVSESRIDLVWNASSDNVGVTAYDIRRDGVLIDSVSMTSYSDTGLVASTNYSYEVIARDAAGNLSSPATASATTDAAVSDTQAPTTPGNLIAQAASTSRIDLVWSESTDNVGVDEYSIRRDGASIARTTDTSYSDSGLTANTTYSYEVVALDAAGNASAPAIASATTATDASTPVTPPSGTSSAGGGSIDWMLLLLLGVMGVRMVCNRRIRSDPMYAR